MLGDRIHSGAARLITEDPAPHRAAAPSFHCGHLAEGAPVSEKEPAHSLSASLRASLIAPVTLFLKSKSGGTKWVEKFRTQLVEGPKTLGRPPENLKKHDRPYLIEMGRLLENGEAKSLHRAATIVMTKNPQLTKYAQRASVSRRLSEAFKNDEGLYRRLGREKIAEDETPENL